MNINLHGLVYHVETEADLIRLLFALAMLAATDRLFLPRVGGRAIRPRKLSSAIGGSPGRFVQRAEVVHSRYARIPRRRSEHAGQSVSAASPAGPQDLCRRISEWSSCYEARDRSLGLIGT
jgi:hypothetical protein